MAKTLHYYWVTTACCLLCARRADTCNYPLPNHIK